MSYNPNSYPPPPGNGQQNYPPSPRYQNYPPPPRQDYTPPPPPQNSYGEYRPPSEDQYRYSPRTSGMQVDQYAGEPHYGRRNSGPRAASQYRDGDGGYYAPQSYYDRPSSRGSRKERDSSRSRGEKPRRDAEKKVGATLLGGAVAGWAGHELGNSNSLVTVASALAGAYAGHKLEEKREKTKREHRDGDSRSRGDGHDDRRHSRSRSRSRRHSDTRRRSKSRSSSTSSSESDSSRRRHRHRY